MVPGSWLFFIHTVLKDCAFKKDLEIHNLQNIHLFLSKYVRVRLKTCFYCLQMNFTLWIKRDDHYMSNVLFFTVHCSISLVNFFVILLKNICLMPNILNLIPSHSPHKFQKILISTT